MPDKKRGLAFGLFYTGYGCGWLVGSIAVGLLYEHSHTAVVIFAVAAQILSLPILLIAGNRRNA